MKVKNLINATRLLGAFALMAGLCFFQEGQAQVVINEFLASNSSVNADPVYNDYADWLELYNAGTIAVNLQNYSITDNLGSPAKWIITLDTVLQPGACLLIWADDTGTGLHANYKISASGEELGVFAPDGTLVDSVIFGIQKTDVSFGRISDGDTSWGYFSEPTPGRSNNTSAAYADVVYFQPEFSLRGGFHSGPVDVALHSRFGGTIRYTLDGSEPDAASPPYMAPIHLENTTVLRARIFIEGNIPGPVITQSYFINENSVNEKLPVVSLAAAPENFWDPEKGIYTQDFKPDWEIPVNIELYENNGSDRAGFNQMAGVKVNGLYSWQLPQKMLGVYFKNAYGDGNLIYPLTPQRNRTSYRSFALRASGSDWSYTLFRDILGQDATQLNMNLDIMGFRPAVVYVNGEYLGIHNIREKVDADYIENSHGLAPGSFDLVENQDYPEAGDLDAYNSLRTLLDKDLSVDANYEAVAELVDIENFTDLFITEMAVRNTSISHNVMSWKPKGSGKWKAVVMDLDRGFFSPGSRLLDFYLSQDQLFLNELFRNTSYRSYFARRLSAHLFTTFNPDRMVRLIDKHAGNIEDEVPKHIQRWLGTTSSYGDAMPSFEYWQQEVENLRSFVRERPAALLNDMQNYGFSGTANLSLTTYPENSGMLYVDKLKAAESSCSGPYLKDLPVEIEARPVPGYTFEGWYALNPIRLISAGSNWKYLDNGQEADQGWNTLDFNDDNWAYGPSELGYGDNDESTVLDYGADDLNKYITYYFRKVINLTAEQAEEGTFFLDLLCDDGAVVYINGKEAIRKNMPAGAIDHQTLASSSVSGSAEATFTNYSLDAAYLHPGPNVFAVEVHQRSATSSDISFNMELACYLASNGSLYSTNSSFDYQLTDDIFFNARFTQVSSCMLPSVIDDEVVLSSDCSPVLVQENVLITREGRLIVEPGVEIYMPENAHIFVEGILDIHGSSDSLVTLQLHPDFSGSRWGGIVFNNTDTTSTLNYLVVEDASSGPDPVTSNAAISAFRADLNLDHVTLLNVHSNPLLLRYSDLVMTNSKLHSGVTGDLVNVKYGHAYIANCSFAGNDQPDTDAIDYDEVIDGVIRNCTISDFYGPNSDAIDIGEQASGIIIDSIIAFNISDKGVSLGQHSSARITNSVFVNCNMGVAIKDTSTAHIVNCTFYNTGYSIACYEKNAGLAGGNGYLQNNILSNSYLSPYMADKWSNIHISNTLSDTEMLPQEKGNLFADPGFINPDYNDFSLLETSPCINSGEINGAAVNLGANLFQAPMDTSIMISEFFINGMNDSLPEYIKLYNPTGKRIDLSGYQFTKGITGMLPEGASIDPVSYVYITDPYTGSNWNGSAYPVYRWTSGRLENSGERIEIANRYGVVIDHFQYEPESWPYEGFASNYAFSLSNTGVDNHFAKNWTTIPFTEALQLGAKVEKSERLTVYPNPSNGLIHIVIPGKEAEQIRIYDLRGALRKTIFTRSEREITTDISDLETGIYIIKAGPHVQKIILR